MIDRPSGSYIEDPTTGEITPNLEDHAMAAREKMSSGLLGHRVIESETQRLNDPTDPIDSTTKEEDDVKD